MHRVRVWDGPTRLFHWSLTASVLALIITGNVGGLWMEWHLWLGYFVLSLLLFRLLWGFVGGRWSRFASFVYAPGSLWAYLRGRSPLEHRVGHNPLGALSVFALLLVLLLQVLSGLLTDDAIFYAGPWVAWASPEWVDRASNYHDEVGKLLLIGLVALHLLALVYYKLVKREALVAAMVTGDKVLPQAQPASPDGSAQWALAAGCYAVAAGLSYALVNWPLV
ncbi:MAG: cytochrome b [Comamonadaceae bacterium]|nr:cytochrome b [Comamonadaceae bacterium]